MLEKLRKLSRFQKEALEQHNKYRLSHHAEPLKWSDKLGQSAKKWATALSKLRAINHEDIPEEGENIAFAKGKEIDGKTVTTMWYDEGKEYNYDSPSDELNTGHFTQLIWAQTKEFGIYKVVVGDETYVVARYHPPGNIIGRFKEFVKPLIKKDSDILENHSENLESKQEVSLYPDKMTTNFKENITTDEVYLDYYNQEILQIHNKIRAAHNAKPLILNKDLRSQAQELAKNYLLFKSGETLEPEFPSLEIGKSITLIKGKDLPSPKSICASWYDGINQYNFEEGKYNNKNGGFTQMVWKNSAQLGVGVYWKNDYSVIVGLYFPAGNIEGTFKENVESEKYLAKVTNV